MIALSQLNYTFDPNLHGLAAMLNSVHVFCQTQPPGEASTTRPDRGAADMGGINSCFLSSFHK